LEPTHKTLHEVRPKVGKNVFVYGNPAWLFDMLDAWRELSGAPAADAPREALKAAKLFPEDVMGCLAAAIPEERTVLENRARLHTPLHRNEVQAGDLQGEVPGLAHKTIGVRRRDLSPRPERRSGRAARDLPSNERGRQGRVSAKEGT
jgi:hypothetical protein